MDKIRNGNFTSSEIYKLMSNGKTKGSYGAPFYEYIEECNMERRLGRSLDDETTARALSWGRLVEKKAFNVLGIEYVLCSSKTLSNPEIDYHKGSPDALTDIIVSDLKCPLTLKSFCQLVDPYYEDGKLIHEGLTIESAMANHKDGKKYFWQIVSNAIITGKKKGQLIVYVPYQDELQSIREMADGNPDYYWIWGSRDEQLPYLIRGGHYKNVNVIEFDILQIYIDQLIERIKAGGELLIPWK